MKRMFTVGQLMRGWSANQKTTSPTPPVVSWPMGLKIALAAGVLVLALLAGAGIGALGGLFTYVGVSDQGAPDGGFLAILAVGVGSGLVIGYLLAKRTITRLSTQESNRGIVLLKKYQRRAERTGEDDTAGRRHIDSAYQRALRGR